MAYLAGNGIRYPSSVDPCVDRIVRIDHRDPDALASGVAAVRSMLARREREELPDADGVRYARLRLAGSIRDLRLARGRAPRELHAIIDEVLDEAERAHGAAPDFDRGSGAAPAAGPVAPWVPKELGGTAPPEKPISIDDIAVTRIDLEDDP